MSRIPTQLFLRLAGREGRQEVQNLLNQVSGGGRPTPSRIRGGRSRGNSGEGNFLDNVVSAFVGRHHPALDRLRRELRADLSPTEIARELMRGAGLLDEPQGRTQIGRGGRSGRGGVGSGGLPPDEPPQPPTPPPSPLQPTPRGQTGQRGAPPLPGEESPYGQEILTPQSSNVFSFSYQPQTSTLYVTYKANRLNPDSVRTVRGRGKHNQLAGRSGSTIRGKTNSRGPMYAYHAVPVQIFNRMRAAQSKGRFVWDNLRIRGTIYGHKYNYTLAQAQVVATKGVSGVYVPRKATKKGFQTRSVATVGQGRRGFITSTLPERVGVFRSRRPPGR